jgi:hypothetical protein
MTPLQQLLHHWQDSKPTGLPHGPIWDGFIEDAKDALEREKQTSVIEAVTKIHSMNFKKENTLIELTEMFYSVCREFGIKQGTPTYTEDGKQIGRNCNTPQWNIVKDAFERKVVEYFSFLDILEDPPKDLMM